MNDSNFLCSIALFGLIAACTSPRSSAPSTSQTAAPSAAPPPASAPVEASRVDEAALESSDAGADASAEAGEAGAKPGSRPRARFPKLILAPATQNFACNNYVNCFDDEHGRCAGERDGGRFDAEWTARTRAAADGSRTACCYKTTMCKRPLPENY